MSPASFSHSPTLVPHSNLDAECGKKRSYAQLFVSPSTLTTKCAADNQQKSNNWVIYFLWPSPRQTISFPSCAINAGQLLMINSQTRVVALHCSPHNRLYSTIDDAVLQIAVLVLFILIQLPLTLNAGVFSFTFWIRMSLFRTELNWRVTAFRAVTSHPDGCDLDSYFYCPRVWMVFGLSTGSVMNWWYSLDRWFSPKLTDSCLFELS